MRGTAIYRTKGGVGLLAVFTVPVGMALAVLSGAIYALAPAYNPWSIANPLAFIALNFALVGSCMVMFRFGKVRTTYIAVILGVLAAVLMTLSTFETLRLIERSTEGPIEFHRTRLSTGITLFGSAGLVKGWLLMTIWVLGLLTTMLIGLMAGAIESNHPFCDECSSWARRERWKFTLKGPNEEDAKEAKASGRCRDVAKIRQGGRQGQILIAKIKACKCGNVATMSARTERPDSEIDPGTDIVVDEEVTAREIELLFNWAEGLSMQAPPRPKLAVLDRLKADAESLSQPFELPGPPEGGEYTSSFRWLGGMLDGIGNNEATKELRKRLALGDYSAAEIALRAQRHPSDRSFVADACGDWEDEPEWLSDWIEDKPQSPEANLVRGIYGVYAAWKIRGSGWVPKDVDNFWDRLREADADLNRAAELLPQDPTPWAWMLWTAKGLQFDHDEEQRRFNEAIKRSPGHRAAHSFYLDAIKPKWGGSREQVEAFAADTLKRARPGSHMLVVIPEAIVELAEYDAPHGQSKPDPASYYARPDIVAQLRSANDLLFRSDRFKMNMDTPRTRAWFAYALWKAGLLDEAAEHLRIIGPSTPWGPFPAPVFFLSKDTIKKARKQCGVR